MGMVKILMVLRRRKFTIYIGLVPVLKLSKM